MSYFWRGCRGKLNPVQKLKIKYNGNAMFILFMLSTTLLNLLKLSAKGGLGSGHLVLLHQVVHVEYMTSTYAVHVVFTRPHSLGAAASVGAVPVQLGALVPDHRDLLQVRQPPVDLFPQQAQVLALKQNKNSEPRTHGVLEFVWCDRPGWGFTQVSMAGASTRNWVILRVRVWITMIPDYV